MARRRTDSQADAPGQDSFLDVVANLVGIMIILIMVVGFAAKKAIVEAAPTPDATAAAANAEQEEQAKRLQDEVAAAERAAQAVEADVEQTAAQLERDKFEIAFRRSERDKFLTLVTAANRVLEDQRQGLDAAQREQFDLNNQMSAAQQRLEEMRQAKAVVEQAGAPPGVIEHLPTPMAKTVFGKELHFRLLGHRLVYVPWDDLVDKLKADAPQKVAKLRDASKITETIGPMQGFWMRYTLRRTSNKVNTAAGPAIQERVELDRFMLISETDELGEPLETALAPNSEMHTIVRSHEPSRATVTVWVYPDSFGDYRRIKQDLFRLGYLCAARPLPEGHPIGGSPDGSRSSAQ